MGTHEKATLETTQQTFSKRTNVELRLLTPLTYEIVMCYLLFLICAYKVSGMTTRLLLSTLKLVQNPRNAVSYPKPVFKFYDI